MDPISNADRLVLLLRQRLLERSKAASRNATAGPSAAKRSSSLERLQALAAVESVDDRQLGRALIHSVLSEELGAELINEAKFQQVVDQVTETLRSEPTTSSLLSRVLGDLRAAAR